MCVNRIHIGVSPKFSVQNRVFGIFQRNCVSVPVHIAKTCANP